MNGYRFQLVLVINRLEAGDFGTYRCISKNSIGQAEEVVELYGGCPPPHINLSHPRDADEDADLLGVLAHAGVGVRGGGGGGRGAGAGHQVPEGSAHQAHHGAGIHPQPLGLPLQVPNPLTP